MNDELDQLKHRYRNISAPPHLETRIRASVSEARVRSHFWMPAAVTCTAIVAMLWVLPITWLPPSEVAATPAKPSMSTLAALKPAKPATPAPSMTQLRSVSVPRMPAKPRPASSPKPRTHYQFENDTLKEKDHAYI